MLKDSTPPPEEKPDVFTPSELQKLLSEKPRALNYEQIRKLLNVTCVNNDARDCALVWLLLSTGLRQCEVHRARRCDVLVVNGIAWLRVQGKGRKKKDKAVMLAPECYKKLAAFLGWSKSEFLFPGRDGKPLATRSIRYIVKEYLKRAGLSHFHTHSLRHTAATIALKEGLSIDLVQELLRHKSQAMTKFYGAEALIADRIDNAPEKALDNILKKSHEENRSRSRKGKK